MKKMLYALPLFLALVSCSRAKPIVTDTEYAQVKGGMSLKEVEKIVGAAGKREASSNKSGLKIDSYSWRSEDGSYMTGEFENDKLTTSKLGGGNWSAVQVK